MCGAKKTELAYLTGLRKTSRNSAVAAKVLTHPCDPDRVIEYARKFRDRAGSDFDQTWCVLDVDQFDYTRALPTAERNNINLAISNPCFETWLLLHHIDLHAPLRNAGATQDLLKQVVPAYDKTDLDFSDFAPQVPEAIRRAKLMASKGSALGDNPSSGMWELVELIAAAST